MLRNQFRGIITERGVIKAHLLESKKQVRHKQGHYPARQKNSDKRKKRVNPELRKVWVYPEKTRIKTNRNFCVRNFCVRNFWALP